jgi:hypothetical protein
VAGAGIYKGSIEAGCVPNRVFGVLDTKPRHVGFTLNSDTPHGPVLLDLSAGPFVVELPAGPLIGAALDLNQRWVADMGVPGPDAGKGASTSSCRRATRTRFPADTTSGGVRRTR